MEKAQRNIIPVLLGADLNAYSVALAFREAYGVTSHVFARYPCGETKYSKFIITHIHAGLDNPEIAIPALLKFADENNGAELFLIPCADWYVEMLESAKTQLSGIYSIFIPQRDLWRALSDKSSFYSAMERAGISYPSCVSIKYGDSLSRERLCAFGFPAVLKPADSSEYWRNPFEDMKKVYFPQSYSECAWLIDKIFESGYRKSLILQKKIDAGDGNRVLTTVSDKSGRVIRAVVGDVILEERGNSSLGNHSAIVTKPLNALCFQLIDFLSKHKYTGIANFDLMFSGKEEFVLELNPRQGRSCDYLRASGVNIAELIVRASRDENIAPDFSYREIYWHHPPHATVMKYASSKNSELADRLLREGRAFTPYGNEYEGIRRSAYVFVHKKRLKNKFRRNYEKG